jgi:2-iminobutanoate/2-iminopropanoate deaminase
MKKKSLILVLAVFISFSVFCFAGSFSQDNSAAKKIFYPGDKPSPTPFSPAILIKDTLFISGQLATDPGTGKFEPGTMAQQAERVIKNIELLLTKAGMKLADVVQTTVYITDFAEFEEFNVVFRKFFPQDPPTRATVQVAKLARDAKIEISAVAMK